MLVVVGIGCVVAGLRRGMDLTMAMVAGVVVVGGGGIGLVEVVRVVSGVGVVVVICGGGVVGLQ